MQPEKRLLKIYTTVHLPTRKKLIIDTERARVALRGQDCHTEIVELEIFDL